MDLNTQPVSEDLQKLLNRVKDQQDTNQLAEVEGFLHDEDLPPGLHTCTWWDGCYYCQDENGNWKSVLCMS